MYLILNKSKYISHSISYNWNLNPHKTLFTCFHYIIFIVVINKTNILLYWKNNPFYKFLKYTKICLIKWWYENSKYNQLKFSQLKIKFKTKKPKNYWKVILTLEPWTCIRQNRQQTKKYKKKGNY